MLLDGPAVMMLFVVTLISLLVHVYSTDYVGGDRRYTHYFAFLSLFTASMLGLVMSESTLQLLTCWELVGLCSFALIGHWWEEKPNSDAALKAFITNRVGDVGLICGVIILFFGAGQTFSILEINEMAVSGEISHLVLLVASCSLIAAVMSKSGQFILHTWLPDAMAGPTPVSALIHAATMVVAGIFMVGRLYSVFFQGLSIGTSSVNLLAVVGGVTVLGGAGLAFVQNDIKKVLAYSTVSQLGYMVMALGVGAWTAAMFHLFTHAMFKAGLFLGSGSVAHAVHSFDMKKDMGGMKRFMPKTYWTFVICTAALIGLFPLAGFWSKDEILAGAEQLGNEYTAFLVVGLLGAFMTAAYMTRCVYLTFHGEPRGHAADPEHPPHESGPRIVVPLYILTAMAIVAGFANIPNSRALERFPDGQALRFEHYFEPKGDYFPSALQTFAHPEFNIGIALVSMAIGLTGIGLAYLWYFRGRGPHGITERNRLARTGHGVLVKKYYFDWLYTDVIVHAMKGPIARAAYWFNQKGHRRRRQHRRLVLREGGPLRLRPDRPRSGRHHRQRLGCGRRGQRPGPPPDPDRARAAVRRAALRRHRRVRRRADHRHLRNQDQNGTMDNNDFLTDWGLSLMVFLPLAGALLMMLIPKGEEQLLKIVALGASLASGGVRHRRDGRLRLRRRRRPPVRGGQAVDRCHQGQLLRRHRRAVAAAHRPHAADHAAVHHLQLEPLPRAAQPQGLPDPHPRAAHRDARHLRRPGPHPLLRLLRARAPADVLHDRRVGRRAAPVRRRSSSSSTRCSARRS